MPLFLPRPALPPAGQRELEGEVPWRDLRVDVVSASEFDVRCAGEAGDTLSFSFNSLVIPGR